MQLFFERVGKRTVYSANLIKYMNLIQYIVHYSPSERDVRFIAKVSIEVTLHRVVILFS